LQSEVPELREHLQLVTPPPAGLPFEVKLTTVSEGYDGKTCWVHPRAGAIPGKTPSVVLTMQKLLLTGSDIFYALNDVRTDDLGTSWSPIKEHADTLGRRNEPVTRWWRTGSARRAMPSMMTRRGRGRPGRR
jgi:hypothetical protein